MKIAFKNYKTGELKLQADTADDFWVLSQVIESKDLVTGRSFRKVKLGGPEGKAAVIKKPVTLTIEVEKVEFSPYSASLRISGLVREGPEDVPHGSHHTIEVEEGTVIKIKKEHLYGYQIDKIEEAAKGKVGGVLICVLDREEAGFALLKQYGYEWLSEIAGNVEKKGLDEKRESTFYADIVKQVAEYVSRYKIEHIIIGSPAFWKEELMKELKKKHPELASKVTLATCCESGREGLNEILKRDEVKTVLQQQRVSKEMRLVDELLAGISKESLAAYGMKDVKEASEAGAVKTLLVADSLIQKLRQDKKFEPLDYIMRLVDKSKGEIVLVSSEHGGGKELLGLGGIGAILRYKMKY